MQKEIVKSAFSGGNYDYSESSNIAVCYRDGIKEFYRFNGFELDDASLEKAVPLASKAFNEAMGIDNNAEFSTFVGRLGRVAVMIVVAIFVLIVAISVKVFMFNDGRTKMFSHYASSMICAGLALVALCVLNFALQFAPNMYLTENGGLNIAMGQAFNVYFIILACFGAVLLVGGYSMMIYVYRYYVRKAQHQKQELEINKTLYVGGKDGDKTIGELAEEHEKCITNRRKNNMELIEAYKGIEKNLVSTNEELGFKKKNDDETTILFEGKKVHIVLFTTKTPTFLNSNVHTMLTVSKANSTLFLAVCLNLMLLTKEILSQHQTRLLTNLKNSLRSTSLSILTRLRCQNQFQEQRQRTVL